ncbi:MAG: hypothetical protein JNL42_19515 [Anaerolineae bacterium]|nr:hypothetical protein [Anaerolineae bacterium]
MAEAKDPRRITTESLLRAVAVGDSRIDQMIVPALMAVGVLHIIARIALNHPLGIALAVTNLIVLMLLAANTGVRRFIVGARFTRGHALHILMNWFYSSLWIALIRLVPGAPLTGKSSEQTYFLIIVLIAVGWMFLRSAAVQTRAFHARFSTAIPLWEQMLLAANELIATGLAALTGANVLVRLFQPDVFTVRFDTLYTGGLLAVTWLYYLGMQLMWTQRWNDWLSQSRTWLRLARLFAPLALIVCTQLIYRRFLERGDPRTAGLLGDTDLDLAVLAITPVLWLLIVVLIVIVVISRRGLRERFLPDDLLERLPARLTNILKTISDMDMLLILGVLATLIPAYLLLLGDTGGLIGLLRQQVLQRGSALIETSEQALALLFALPFYVLLVALLALYGFALGRSALPAEEREALVEKLPVGFLIVLIITLYMFAVPFSQVLTEGRLPELPQDLGRILAYNVVIPLVLLYAHYFVLIRSPYARGQKRWRERKSQTLVEQLDSIQKQIGALNQHIDTIELAWQRHHSADARSMDNLFRYVQLNSQRDDLNMQRLRLLDDRQQLNEISETPVSVAVARLPVRIVSIGIPLLLIIQVYQWAIVNDGLRQIINDPSLTILDFFRAILQQTQF